MSPTHRVGACDGWILAAAAFAAAPLAVFAPLGMAPLFAVAALALLIADAFAGNGWPRGLIAAWRVSRSLRLFALLGALVCAWAVASATWAVEPAQALTASGQVFGTLCAAIVCLAAAYGLPTEMRARIGKALLAGLIAAATLLIAERLSDAWIGHQLGALGPGGPDQIFSRYNRALSVLLMLAAPALIALRGAGARWALGILALGLVAAFYGSSLQLAALAGVIALLLALALPRVTPWLTGGAVALFVAAAPLLPPLTAGALDTDTLTARTQNVSIAHRIIVWQFSAERIAEKPLAGWGMNAARAIPGGKEKVVLIPNATPILGEKLPLHTHNAPLQWWLELGLPGAVLMAGLWLFALVALARAFPARGPRAFALAGYAAAFVIAGLSYGAWQAWWLATLGLAAALLAAQAARPRETS
ncbi:MAG: O-antigen ligase family protein [Alphaproteobacteria bacterium]